MTARRHITVYLGPAEERALAELVGGASRHGAFVAVAESVVVDPDWEYFARARSEPIVGKFTVSLPESVALALEARLGSVGLTEGLRSILLEAVCLDEDADAPRTLICGHVPQRPVAPHSGRTGPSSVSAAHSQPLPVFLPAPRPSGRRLSVTTSDGIANDLSPHLILHGTPRDPYTLFLVNHLSDGELGPIVDFLNASVPGDIADIWFGIDVAAGGFWPVTNHRALLNGVESMARSAAPATRGFTLAGAMYIIVPGPLRVRVTVTGKHS